MSLSYIETEAREALSGRTSQKIRPSEGEVTLYSLRNHEGDFMAPRISSLEEACSSSEVLGKDLSAEGASAQIHGSNSNLDQLTRLEGTVMTDRSSCRAATHQTYVSQKGKTYIGLLSADLNHTRSSDQSDPRIICVVSKIDPHKGL